MSPFIRVVLSAAALLCSAGLPAAACDSAACAAAMRYSDGNLAPGRWRLDFSVRHVDQSRRLYEGGSADAVYRPRVDLGRGGFDPASHEELSAAMTFLQMEATYAITGSLSASATLPVYRRTAVDSRHVLPPVLDDTPLPPGHEHGGAAAGTAVDMQNRSAGVGDFQLGLRHVAWSSGSRQLTAGLTLKLPTGSHDVTSVDGVVDPMLQPGTGAADVVGLLQYTQKVGGTGLSAVASLQKTTASSAGYRYGDDIVVAVGANRSLSPRVSGQIQVKGQRSGRHRLNEVAVPSTGLSVVQVAPGLRVRLRPDVTLYCTLQVPAWVHVNESQLGPRATVTAGVVKAF